MIVRCFLLGAIMAVCLNMEQRRTVHSCERLDCACIRRIPVTRLMTKSSCAC